MKKVLLLISLISIACFIAILTVKYDANRYSYKRIKFIPTAPVGIIFGAGYKANGEPSKYLKDRLDTGISLLNAGKVKVLLLSGDNGRKSHDELAVMKKYCLDRKIDSTKIFLDYAGFDTYSTLYRAKHIFRVNKAILVSQNYHLDRAIFTGRMLGITSYGLSANNGRYPGYRINSIRESLAIINAIAEVGTGRKPRILGSKIALDLK